LNDTPHSYSMATSQNGVNWKKKCHGSEECLSSNVTSVILYGDSRWSDHNEITLHDLFVCFN
jgi:hypothetical protein